MNQIAIFANGKLSTTNISLPADGLVIAADGGARHCLALGIRPDIVIGDFDSLSEEEITVLAADNIVFVSHPPHKDETDLELALDHAVRLDANEVTLYGLFGGRLDMTLANIMLLASEKYTGIHFRILDGNTRAFILHAGEILDFEGQPGDTVSAIPINGTAKGLTYEGLQWHLDDAILPFGSPRGVSNLMTASNARIYLQEGILFITVTKFETDEI